MENFDSIFCRLIEDITTGSSFDEAFELIYKNLRRVIQYNRIGIAFLKDGNKLVSRKAISDGPITLGENFEEDISGSSLEEVIKKGEPRIINDLEDYLRQKPSSKTTQMIVSEGMRSSFTLPLLIKGKPVGVIFFSSRNKNNYSEKDATYLKMIAGHMAISFEKAMLIEELKKTNEKLMELNKMKDEFVSITSHDLRSPLTSILAFSELFLMEKYGKLTEKQREGIDIINRAGRHLLELTNALLDLAKIEAGKVELNVTKGKMSNIIMESINAMKFNASEKKIDIKMNLPEKEHEMTADWLKLFQVMNNLISNAIKFTYEGGNITIGLRYNQGEAVVSVADTGQGIAKEDVPHIFDRFIQAKSKATRGEKGSGLGLAIAKNLIELHGGRIWVESGAGRGAVFYFAMPIK